ncbi:hypothetical protein [Micavibrio aeruginosavorus]|uniref:hypothetical protein n=1 Tax=Micavibrio aeruginosavorus TaxID=349221 RepID=UPI003F4AACB3
MKLYHSSPVTLEAAELTPRTRNIRLAEREDGTAIARFTDYADTNPPFVYATDNPSLSLTYAVPKGVRLGNMHGLGGAEILFLDQESKIGDPTLEGGIYSFDSDDFVQIHRDDGQATDQWVSGHAVNLERATFQRVESLNDLMRAGVQVYQVADHYSTDDFYTDVFEIANDPDGAKERAMLDRLVEEGKVRWLNEERMIRPENCLKTETSGARAQPDPAFKPYSL